MAVGVQKATTPEKEINSFKEESISSGDLEKHCTDPANPFSEPAVAEYYRREYESAKYECRHVFDPSLVWTKQEEHRVVRKIDWHIMGVIILITIGLKFTSGALAQATGDNMLEDLKIDTNQYNLGNQLGFFLLLSLELPVQLIVRRFGADRVIPFQLVIRGILGASHAAIRNATGLYILKIFNGLCGAGILTTITIWLTSFYSGSEVSVRIAIIFASMKLEQVLSSFLAFAVLRMRGLCNLSGWQWLFIVEGTLTTFIGVAVLVLMPASIVQTRGRLSGIQRLTERETLIAVNRLLRDDPSKGTMHNRQAITPMEILRALKDHNFWLIYLLYMIEHMPEIALTPYLILNIRNLGFSAVNVQLMTIPSSTLSIISTLALSKISQIIDERSLIELLPAVWKLITIGLLRWWPGSFIQPWPTYALLLIMAGTPACAPIHSGWISRNANSVRSRAVALATANMLNQTGIIIAQQVYRKDDAPRYHRGNTILFFVTVSTIPMMILAKAYFIWRNKIKERTWNAMSEAERVEYTVTTADKDSKRLDFRFVH
ncbi:AaceriAEL344CAp [[Ashbya] aceris (nom. inval.)]|nr:AaceriAEL344CAp [[Ashbya] aceris (nom. inval.)]